jgi:hypothetical protein
MLETRSCGDRVFFGINYFENIIDELIYNCSNVNIGQDVRGQELYINQDNLNVTSNQFVKQNSSHCSDTCQVEFNNNTTAGADYVHNSVTQCNTKGDLSSIEIQGNCVCLADNGFVDNKVLKFLEVDKINQQLPLCSNYNIDIVNNV